ncbi:unnamed protein product [Closterium sp. Yama58-4]|nr:unnamed protein product [Closterium sp. Yama58-4]
MALVSVIPQPRLPIGTRRSYGTSSTTHQRRAWVWDACGTAHIMEHEGNEMMRPLIINGRIAPCHQLGADPAPRACAPVSPPPVPSLSRPSSPFIPPCLPSLPSFHHFLPPVPPLLTSLTYSLSGPTLLFLPFLTLRSLPFLSLLSLTLFSLLSLTPLALLTLPYSPSSLSPSIPSSPSLHSLPSSPSEF